MEPRGSQSRDDAELLASCRRGDSSAWEELIRRYRRLIYSIPFTCGLSSDSADDVFQRVALLLFENLGRIQRPEKLASWITITTRRECWALKREGNRTRAFGDGEAESMPEDSPDLDRAIDLVAGEHSLALAWERLAEPCRSLLGALYLEEPKPSHAELAERLGRPIGSLGPTHGRCLDKLRKLFAEQGGELPVDWEQDPFAAEKGIGRGRTASRGKAARPQRRAPGDSP